MSASVVASAGSVRDVGVVAAAEGVTPSPGGPQRRASALSAAPPVETGAPVMVVVAASPSLGVHETVPRLTMQPASVADGPVHGLFNTPVRT